jgi:hypothetical protein
MSGITLKNPVVNSVPITISIGRKNINLSATSLSTGFKANNDVVNNFLGRNLNDRSKILNQFYKNVGYGLNIAQTAQEGLNSIARTLVEMQGIINSVGGSQTNIRTLNDIFQQKLLQIEQQTNSVKFDGVKLLTGEFGSDPTIKSKYNTKIVDVRKTGIGSGTLFEGTGTRAVKIIDVQNIANIKAGDTISLHDVNFKMVQNKELITSESDILIGESEEQTVANIATAFKNHPSESLRLYNVTTRNKQVIITQRSASTVQIPLIVKSENNGVLDNSNPSTYFFTFRVNATVRSKLTISGVTFEFVANGTGGGDPTKLEVKNNKYEDVKTLHKAIENHPITKDLIDQNMLFIKEYTSVGLIINSVFNKDILGFKAEFNVGDIHHNISKTSKTTTHACEIKFIQTSVIGDIITFKKPNGTMQNYNVNHQLDINDICESVYNQFYIDVDIGINNIGGLMQQENLCVNHTYKRKSVTLYSNYDLKLQYIPVGVNQAIYISPAPISIADVSVIKPAINVSNIRNLDGFIEKPKVNVKVVAQAVSVAGDELASILYRQAKGDVPLPTIPVDGDITTVLHVDIAGRTFQSVVWQGNGTNLNNRELVFTEASTGETFSINTKDLNSDITTLENTINTLAKPIENLLSSTEFAQIRDLEINNSSEEIIDDSGRVIGNVEGMTVALNSTDFSNKQFEDFVIIPDPVIIGNTLFIATINGQEFVCKIRANKLNEGKALTFSASNGDTLTINIGKGGINSLSDPKNYKYIASAMKKSLMKIGSGIDLRTGFDSDNVSKLAIGDISDTKLYRNNQNEHIPKLDLLTKESAKISQEVITNALNLIYSARVKLQGQGDNLERSANSLSSTLGVTRDASSSYLDTDLIEASSTFTMALKSILATVSTLQVGAKVADAGLEIIKSISTT